MPKAKIFLNYRRVDSEQYVLGLGMLLDARFPGQVFWDRDTLSPGVKYRAEIEATLKECAVVVAVIGEKWLDVRDEDGNKRLENADDVLRLELKMALDRDIPVIPVLVGSAAMPNARDLPKDLRALTDWNAMRLSADDPKGSYRKLFEVLEQVLAERAKREEEAEKARLALLAEEKRQREELLEKERLAKLSEEQRRLEIEKAEREQEEREKKLRAEEEKKAQLALQAAERARLAKEQKEKKEAQEKAAAAERARRLRERKNGGAGKSEVKELILGWAVILGVLGFGGYGVYAIGRFGVHKYQEWKKPPEAENKPVDEKTIGKATENQPLNLDPYFGQSKGVPLGALSPKPGSATDKYSSFSDYVAKNPNLAKSPASVGPRFVAGTGINAGTVTDTQTGLVWEKDIYKLTRENNAAEYSAPAIASRDSKEAKGGYTDWRVPAKAEYAAIDMADFPKIFGPAASLYETESKDYYRFINNGLASAQQTSNDHYLRLVRGGITAKSSGNQLTQGTPANKIWGLMDTQPKDRIAMNGNTLGKTRFVAGNGATAGTITDTQTGLVWMKDVYKLTKDDGTTEYSATATAGAANTQGFGGYKDWRVPTKAEYAAIDVAEFPKFFGIAPSLYESNAKEYYRYTNNGLSAGQQTTNYHVARLVRGGSKPRPE